MKIKERIDRIQKKDEKREKELRHTARKIDQKAMQSGLIRKFGLAIYFFLVHMKAYIQEVFYAVFYLMAYLSFKTTKRLSKLLEPERIRINNIRFCWITLVLELLSLDLILFIHLEGDDPCLKFFELVSTVVIIPVLLSWLAELKIKKNVSQ